MLRGKDAAGWSLVSEPCALVFLCLADVALRRTEVRAPVSRTSWKVIRSFLRAFSVLGRFRSRTCRAPLEARRAEPLKSSRLGPQPPRVTRTAGEQVLGRSELGTY